jgi:hypothetical protein
MKYKILCLLLASFSLLQVKAQDEELPAESRGFDKSRLFFGGTLGATFGDYTFVNVSPQVGYRFNEYLGAGVGVNFIYNSIKYRDVYDHPVTREDYGYTGLSIFGRVYPLRVIMLQVQPELNYSWGEWKNLTTGEVQKLDNVFVPSLLVGGGAAIPTGGGAFTAMLQYDLIQNVRSPYGSKAFLSFGYSFGF